MSGIISKLLFIVWAVAILVTGSAIAIPSNKTQAVPYELNKENFIILDGEINSNSIDKVLIKLTKNTNKTLFLYINSPGGSVQDGAKLVQYLQDSPRKITCIADYAASMAFAIFQACPVRVIMRDSILMQHEVTHGVPPMQESKLKSFLEFSRQLIDDIYQMQADRIGMSLEKFKLRIKDDWWIYGTNAIDERAADTIGFVTCSVELLDSKHESVIATLFGMLPVLVSDCPVLDIIEPIPAN